VESSVANLTEYRTSILGKAWAAAARSPHNSGVTTKGLSLTVSREEEIIID
jgi:hypothetical protein